MKKLILACILIAVLFVGCVNDKPTNNITEDDLINSKTNVTFQIQFNEERYIWESFLFPTNRTTGR